jgi:hypothetical protein
MPLGPLPDKGIQDDGNVNRENDWVVLRVYDFIIFGGLAVVVMVDIRPIGFASPIFIGFAFIE